MKSYHIIQETRSTESEWIFSWRNDRIEELFNRLRPEQWRCSRDDLDELHEAMKDAILDAYLVGRGERK